MRTSKNKKQRALSLRNRYAYGAKMSEHKFLKVLRGYADSRTIGELAPHTRVSAKTIRATYTALRARLPLAAQLHPDAFGQAGQLLWSGGQLREGNGSFLQTLEESRLYKRHRQRHTPRLERAELEQLLLLETAIRFLCALDLRASLHHHGDREAILMALGDAVPTLKGKDWRYQLCAGIPGARPHGHPHKRLFDDYRRALLRCPLGS